MGNRELALEITGRQACVMAQQIHRSRITVLCYPVIFMLWAVCGIVQASAILDTPTPTPCAPEIQITHIPSYGTYDDVRGVLTCAGSPHEYKIAVYIWVPELWWTKPSYDNPCLTPAADGSWSCDITSGGCDPYAFRIAAFLLPGDALCPVARGTADLPSELETLALASHVVDCSPG
ncbi:MAG TPA: hypothetical protein PLB62_16595, partial [Candidatus Sumerlaeota bacterium]|nr:hypothetical protein [Candidatus Sumerlaeota bacterium]